MSISDLCLLPYFLVTDKSRVFVPCFVLSSFTAVSTSFFIPGEVICANPFGPRHSAGNT